MSRCGALLAAGVLLAVSGGQSVPAIVLVDATERLGLLDPLRGVMGHAVAVGDVNGDGWTDLFVGTFADRPVQVYAERGATGPAPDRLLLGGSDGFRLGPPLPVAAGRTSGAAFADLDGDGDLDLILARNSRPAPRSDASYVLSNDGEGVFGLAARVGHGMGARSLAVFDADGDTRLDLLITEDRWTGGSSRLFRNRGDWRFEPDPTALPEAVHGLGVATADLDGDHRPDIFISGSNRMFLNRDEGFVESVSDTFQWPVHGDEDDPAGIAVADIDRDGRLDLLIGQHFNSTLDLGERVAVRLYRNLGAVPGRALAFQDVTASSGLPGLATKSPHVELVDLDNDGRLDILTTAAMAGAAVPLVLPEREGADPSRPHYEAGGGSGRSYWVCAATFDANHDGRLDVMMVEWYPSMPSRLFLNESVGGNWIAVTVALKDRPAIGSRVEVYRSGRSPDAGALLGVREIGATVGFGAGALQEAHFGLGPIDRVDVVVRAPWTGTIHVRENVRAGSRVCVGDAC